MSRLLGCARCGGDHEVTWLELERPIGAEDGLGDFTHWAPCPVNGDPILWRRIAVALPEGLGAWAIATQTGLGQDDELRLELAQDGLAQRLLIIWPADNDPEVHLRGTDGRPWV